MRYFFLNNQLFSRKSGFFANYINRKNVGRKKILIARNSENHQIQAEKQLTKSTDYYCPSCQQPVHLKAGSVTRPHFAHYQKQACDVFSEGETQEHIQGKLQLKEWLEDQDLFVEMEAYLPELRQRPDLLVTIKHRKLAIEFQCSPIAISKVVERTNGYRKAGYEVVWILGEAFKYNKQLTAFQKACLTNIKNQLVLFHYSVTQKRLEYRYHFTLKQNQKMQQTKKSMQMNRPYQMRLNQKRVGTPSPVNIEMEHQKLVKQLFYGNDKSKAFLERLYENKETLVSMPKELYAVMPNEWLLQEYPYEWKLTLILWMESHPLNTIMTKKKIKQWMDQLAFYEIPQLSEAQKEAPIMEFIAVLTESNVLKQIRLDKWTFSQRAVRYKYLEDKFA